MLMLQFENLNQIRTLESPILNHKIILLWIGIGYAYFWRAFFWELNAGEYFQVASLPLSGEWPGKAPLPPPRRGEAILRERSHFKRGPKFAIFGLAIPNDFYKVKGRNSYGEGQRPGGFARGTLVWHIFKLDPIATFPLSLGRVTKPRYGHNSRHSQSGEGILASIEGGNYLYSFIVV
jgi:hypothetical protein